VEEGGEQVERAGQRVAGGVAVEHAAARDDVGELAHVALVHDPEPAVEERELEGEGEGGHPEQRQEPVRRARCGPLRSVGEQLEFSASLEPHPRGIDVTY